MFLHRQQFNSLYNLQQKELNRLKGKEEVKSQLSGTE